MDSEIDTTSGGSVAERLARLRLNRAESNGSISSPSLPVPTPAPPTAPPRTASPRQVPPKPAKRPPPPLPQRAHTTHDVVPPPRPTPKIPPTPPAVKERALPPVFNPDLSAAKLPPKRSPVPKAPEAPARPVLRNISPAPNIIKPTPHLPPRLPSLPSRNSAAAVLPSQPSPQPQDGVLRRKLPPPPTEAPPPFKSKMHLWAEKTAPAPSVPPPINISSRPTNISRTTTAADLKNIACLTCRDFSAADQHAARPQFDRTRMSDLRTLGIELTKPFDDPVDKARAIFTWMHHNIAYDVHGFFGGNIKHENPKRTVQKGVAVCQGYAEVYQELAQYAGMECKVVAGFGKGYGYSKSSVARPFETNHAWNAILLPEPYGWHLLDSCWGAGVSSNNPPHFEKKFNPSEFTMLPAEFGKLHFPEKTKWQCVPRPQTWEEFIVEPADRGTQVWNGEFEKDGWSRTEIKPWSERIPAGRCRIVIPKECPHWKAKNPNKKTLLLVVFIAKRDSIPMREIDDCGTVAADIVVHEGEEVKIGAITSFKDRDARGLTADEFVRAGRCSMAYGYMAGWNLPQGSRCDEKQ